MPSSGFRLANSSESSTAISGYRMGHASAVALQFLTSILRVHHAAR